MKSNSLLSELRSSLIATAGLLVIVSGFYPLIVWGISQLVFPDQANGSLIRNSRGQIVGSSLLAQAFDDSLYFHPRPSAAGAGYDAANSSGSNLGSTSQKLIDQIAARAETYRAVNGLPPTAKIPVDAVTASSSGLDPHISVENALLQAPRVAKARHLDNQTMMRLIKEQTQMRQFGFLGEPRVNVLELNLCLDRIPR